MIMTTKMEGIFLYSDSNKMGIFITAQNEEKEEEIYDVASKAYEDWMCCENDSEDWTIGDYIMEELSIKGYEKEEDYYFTIKAKKKEYIYSTDFDTWSGLKEGQPIKMKGSLTSQKLYDEDGNLIKAVRVKEMRK